MVFEVNGFFVSIVNEFFSVKAQVCKPEFKREAIELITQLTKEYSTTNPLSFLKNIL